MTKRLLQSLFAFIALGLLVSACGPSTPQRDPQEPSPAENNDSNLPDKDNDEEQPAQEVSAALITPQAGSGETAVYKDNTVGFTAEGRPYRGDLDAPVVLEEFSDFQCPYCARFTTQTLGPLAEKQITNGEVLLIYYDFPLENIHPQAFAAANAARCAGEQGADAYWRMHDLLYANVTAWSVSDHEPVFVSLAERMDLDTDAFATCQSELRYSDQIKADIEHALSRGVRSTPSFFLNNQPLVGAQPLEAFNQAITTVLSGETIAQEEADKEIVQQESPLQPPPVKPTPAVIDAENYAATLGDPAAPVTIVEYTDYQCPYCQRHSQETLPQLIASKIATGEVYYILKDLPLESIHPNARFAARAARCAGEQDAYWEMHDALFDGMSNWGGGDLPPEEIFTDLAASLDLDINAFTACLADPAHDQGIQTNIEEALALGADSTPFFFVDGLPIPGAQPYGLFEYAIALAKEGKLAEAYVPPEPDLENVQSIGDPNAPVTIIEFTDYQCPFCSRYVEQTFPQIKEKYVDSGQVYYVFKDFPLTNIHPQAVKAAEAVRCAAEQEAFMPMHDSLFERQADWSGNAGAADVFKQLAEDLSLDTAAFAECLDSGRNESAVLADLEEGASMGVNGTPAFFINGHSMSGAQPYAIFEQAIEQFLGQEG